MFLLAYVHSETMLVSYMMLSFENRCSQLKIGTNFLLLICASSDRQTDFGMVWAMEPAGACELALVPLGHSVRAPRKH